MISVMLAISHVVMLSRMAHSSCSINTLHKIDFGYSIDISFLTFPIKWSILVYQSASVRPNYIYIYIYIYIYKLYMYIYIYIYFFIRTY